MESCAGHVALVALDTTQNVAIKTFHMHTRCRRQTQAVRRLGEGQWVSKGACFYHVCPGDDTDGILALRIYSQIGVGERIALSKLAVDHHERSNHPLRIAIDISIWNFQIQSGRGGTNPALRTLYYRLLKLLLLGIKPLFVFDGPNKPPFKRNKKTGFHGASLPNYLAKQLLKFFGFPFHTAPGEAEAECALLQKAGIVDAVMSEDVDTLMFGCTMTMRNWSSEGTRGNKSPTHINLYTADAVKEGTANMDSDGMILIALMSGGDYIPAGIPRCGIKTACEAARAGFGYELCRLTKDDKEGLREFRERLQYELETNESGFFRSKHKAMQIPDSFPDMAVLRYYTHPVVSSVDGILRLASEINWDAQVDIPGLRNFVIEAFEWMGLPGAQKFIRGLAPALLGHRLRERGSIHREILEKAETQKQGEQILITSICGRRAHFTTDATPELRVVYTPIEIVGLDLASEESDAIAAEAYSESEAELERAADSADGETQSIRSGKPKGKGQYDPTIPEKLWVLEAYVKLGVPSIFDSWEESMKLPNKPKSRGATKTSTVRKKQRAIDSFLKVSKPSSKRVKAKMKATRGDSVLTGETDEPASPREAPAPETSAAASPLKKIDANTGNVETKSQAQDLQNTGRRETLSSKVKTPKNRRRENFHPMSGDVNPWTLSKRPPDTLNAKISSNARYSALGIYGSAEKSVSSETKGQAETDSTALSLSDPRSSLQTFSSPSTGRSTSPKSATLQPRDSTPSLPTSPLLIPSSPPSPSRKRANLISIPSYPIEAVGSIGNLPGGDNRKPDSLLEMASSPAESSNDVLEVTAPPSNCPSIHRSFSPKKTSRATGKLIMLRDSLDGRWKTVEPWETKGKYVGTVFKGVEEIDLTSSP